MTGVQSYLAVGVAPKVAWSVSAMGAVIEFLF